MVKIKQLSDYLAHLLAIERYADYCPNGLQVAGCDDINVIVSGVTACQALLDAAVSKQADAIIVHHGYFWKNEALPLVGIKRQRIATLIQHNINLLAYHLPLDMHAELGNNVQLAHVLGLQISDHFDLAPQLPGGCLGHLINPCDGVALAHHIEQQLQRKPLYIPGHTNTIQRVAWCTGAAQNYLDKALAYNIDAYITGEVSEATVHLAREEGIHFFAAGHHATERYGVQSLGAHLAQQFKLTHHFIDIDNPA